MTVTLKRRVAYSAARDARVDRGRRESGERDDRRRPERLRPGLELLRLRRHAPVALGAVSAATGRWTNSDETLLPSASCSDAWRTFIGTIARRPCSGGSSPRAVEQPPQAAGDGRQHDVVDGAAQARLDRLQVGERHAHDREAARRADRRS